MNAASDDDLLPIRALNDLLFCERRCALHRIEEVWTDNAHTLEGTIAHRRAHQTAIWKSPIGARVVHGMWLTSRRLRLVGKADVVEFHGCLGDSAAGTHVEPRKENLPCDRPRGHAVNTTGHAENTADTRSETPLPIEYKRGRRRKWDNDDVQLCAQALCLEEMFGAEVPRGAIFHIKSKRRREVLFTEALRRKTEAAAARLRELIEAGVTPPPVVKPRCRGCSLRDLCLPDALSQPAVVTVYMQDLYRAAPPT